tara:strand:- start:157 stop:627 length:471 start_codon:yes stop_codon:yes gene_type:complete
MQELYVTHLNLEYDKNELKDEVSELDFKPFAPEQYYFRNTWLKAKLREHIFMYPHIEKLHKQLPGSVIVAYKQLANTSVHMHVDPATECSVNIVLSDNFAPVIFEDYGEINYECALFNTSLNHAVPAYEKERLLLKFSFLDTSYDKIREMLNDKIK